MTVPILELPFYLLPVEPDIFIKFPTFKKSIRFLLSPVCSQSGDSGLCEDDRPETGMLYPRG